MFVVESVCETATQYESACELTLTVSMSMNLSSSSVSLFMSLCVSCLRVRL